MRVGETLLYKVASYLSEGAWAGRVDCIQVKCTTPAARSPASQSLPKPSFHPSSSSLGSQRIKWESRKGKKMHTSQELGTNAMGGT